MLGRGLADNTVRRHLGRARQFFAAAIDKGLVLKNPFFHKQIKVAVRGNPDRRQFIPREVIDRVLAVCEDDPQWQAIIALARYGGLRTPSETLALRWSDIDWGNNLITVRCPKLERLERHATRTIPLFAELQPILLRAHSESPEGNDLSSMASSGLAAGTGGPSSSGLSGGPARSRGAACSRTADPAGKSSCLTSSHGSPSVRGSGIADRLRPSITCPFRPNTSPVPSPGTAV